MKKFILAIDQKTAALGAIYLAGLNSGVIKDFESM